MICGIFLGKQNCCRSFVDNLFPGHCLWNNVVPIWGYFFKVFWEHNIHGAFLKWGYPKTMDFNMIYQNSLSLDTPIFGNPHISNAMLRIFAAKSPSCAPSGRSVQAAPQASLTFPSGQVGPKMKYVMCIVYYITLYYIMLCYIMLCYIILCYIILCYIILYYIILYILLYYKYIYIIYYIYYIIY